MTSHNQIIRAEIIESFDNADIFKLIAEIHNLEKPLIKLAAGDLKITEDWAGRFYIRLMVDSIDAVNADIDIEGVDILTIERYIRESDNGRVFLDLARRWVDNRVAIETSLIS
jgi:hypothetical protein